MDTNTQLTAGPLKHRLFVAVPLFTLCFSLSVGLSMSGELLSAEPSVAELNSENVALLNNGIAASGEMTLVESGSSLQMLRGSGLFAARALLTVQAGVFSVVSWNGSVEISMEEGHLTVAALTAPALIRSTDSLWIVPAGMQMRLTEHGAVFADDLAGWLAERTPLPLPSHYLSTRLPQAEELQSIITQSYAVDMPVLPPLLGQSLRLEQSRVFAEERDAAYRVHRLSAAFGAKDIAATQTLLLDEANLAALRSPEGRNALPVLLRDALEMQLTSLLLPLLAENPDMHAIASYHPALRAHAWVLARSASDSQAVLNTLITLPASDRTTEPLPAVAVEQWGKEWQAFLSGSDLKGVIVDAALPRLEADILALDAAGFPERSRLYAQTVVGAFMPHMESAADSAHESLTRLQEFAAGSTPVTTAVEVVEAVTVPDVIEPPKDLPLEPQAAMELEAQVRSHMQSKNAMFTSKSVFKAVAANRVHIENIVLGTPTGDKLLSFTFDPATGMVVDIEKDGRILPYSLPLEGYLEWVGHVSLN